ncbi:MAG TPA: TRAM domain-containing protein [Candidatus Hydrogenedentes bacterium]|nr:TRAM domain-containing protein [Candidatus Hydrogenedentota bacterium]HNT88873.1 TRAM domain-containing protein [Candidatus Hydrogenedentota bacterium]
MEATIEITSLAHGGDGIGRIEGQVCFVPGTLPGDTVRARVVKQAKRALWARSLDVITPSPDRLPLAPAGAATWLYFAYPAQGTWKQRIVTELLARIGTVHVEPEWVEDPALRLGYRTRAEFHGDGARFGYFAPGTHAVLDTPACPLSHERLNAALARLRTLRLKGSVTATVNPEGDDVLVWTGFTNRRLREAFSQAQSPRDEGPRASFLFDGVPIVNGTFSQSSLLLNRLLVRVVHECAGTADRLLDLYCGNGNLSLGLGERMRVAGYDHNRAAVAAAATIGRGEYRAGDEAAMARAVAQGRWDVIVLDPPRTGAKALAPALGASAASRIVYVSCDPATLARDIKTLAGYGWRVARAVVLDLFPNTPHVETVCLMAR